MYMETIIQVQAFRATGDPKYLDRSARRWSPISTSCSSPTGSSTTGSFWDSLYTYDWSHWTALDPSVARTLRIDRSINRVYRQEATSLEFSDDSGVSWADSYASEDYLSDYDLSANGYLWLLSEGEAIRHSEDHGSTWSMPHYIPGSGDYAAAVIVCDPEDNDTVALYLEYIRDDPGLYAKCSILYTQDHGATWTHVTGGGMEALPNTGDPIFKWSS